MNPYQEWKELPELSKQQKAQISNHLLSISGTFCHAKRSRAIPASILRDYIGYLAVKRLAGIYKIRKKGERYEIMLWKECRHKVEFKYDGWKGQMFWIYLPC